MERQLRELQERYESGARRMRDENERRLREMREA